MIIEFFKYIVSTEIKKNKNMISKQNILILIVCGESVINTWKVVASSGML